MTHLELRASGMVTALGFNAPATLAAMRAGVSAVQALPWLDPESGEPLRGAKVRLPQWCDGLRKLAELLAPAIHECLQSAVPASPESIPLLVGVAAAGRPGRPADLEARLLDELSARLGHPLHSASEAFPADQTGAMQALSRACSLLDSGACEQAIVAGVDSLLHAQTLDHYLEQGRLLTASNSNGFFPGEAAAAVLMAAASATSPSMTRIVGAAASREPAPINSTKPFRGQGLTTALTNALASAGTSLNRVAWRLTDLSGEHYKFKEAAFAAGRLGTGPREVPLDLWHPIEYLGEIGAAILPCLLAQADHAFRVGFAPGGLAMCHVGNDDGDRAALVVARRDPLHRSAA